MSFTRDDSWVWDSWWAYDEQAARHHLFYLHASRSLGDPEMRHRNARVGHASTSDLVEWTPHDDPFPEPLEGLDDLATWTGCTVRGANGDGWWLFTTGLSRADDGRVQRIGSARSSDLQMWSRTPLLLESVPQHYQASCAVWPEEAWRDPWVVQDDTGRWHMYVTARDVSGISGCGVVGHAVSADLDTWQVVAPLSLPTGRFEWLEVISVVQVGGRWVLVFSCLSEQMPDGAPGEGGVWSVPVDGPGAAVDVSRAVRLCDESCYAGRVVDVAGSPYLVGFRNHGPDGLFIGGLSDAVPVRWREDGRGLEVAA